MRVIVTDDQMKLNDIEISVRTFDQMKSSAQYGEEAKGWADVDRCKHVRKSKDEHDKEECEAVLPQRLY